MRVSDFSELVLKGIFNQFWLLGKISIFQEELLPKQGKLHKNLLHKNGIIVLHRNKNTKEKLPDFFSTIEERLYGISKIIFGKFLI